MLPVLDDRVSHPTLRVDVLGDLQVLVSGEVWVGSGEEEEDKALQVVVGGAGGDGKAGHPGQNPHDVLGVHLRKLRCNCFLSGKYCYTPRTRTGDELQDRILSDT